MPRWLLALILCLPASAASDPPTIDDAVNRLYNFDFRFIHAHGVEWFEKTLLPRFAPISMLALLATLVLIFAFQADNITGKPFHVALIAIPILLQVYFNSSLAYGLMRLFRVRHAVAAPGALIGASNFFELAVATAIALFGPGSGAALATVVGVLIEVPVMLSVCSFCNRTRHWFPEAEATSPV